MSDFFARIYRGLEGHPSINTKSDEGLLDSERFFSFPKDASYMEKYVSVRSDEDVYCSVATFSIEERSNQDPYAQVAAVWADADTCHPDNFRVPPSIVVQTSPDRWHVWWVLDQPTLAKDAQEAAHRISVAHADQGCDRGWTMTKLLRVPGTVNTKYETPYEVTVEYTDLVYTLDEIIEAYADIDLVATVQLDSAAPEPVDEGRFAELETLIELSGLTSLYLDRPSEGQSWSERMYRLEMELFRQGMTPQEVFSIMREAPANKYNPDNAGERTATGVLIPKRHNPDQTIWNEIQKAYTEHVLAEDVAQEDRPVKNTEHVAFLSLDEKSLIADNPSFVDEYVDWGLSRSPDSLVTYHRSLAWMLLSVCFADRFYIDLQWGKSHPNLWVLVLGESTRGHKSATKNLFLECVELLEVAEDSQVDIGSDVTVEALVQELGQRDGQVSLIHTDEVARFFSENMTKNYRAGTMESFTELYDGKVPVVLRATKGSGNRTKARTVLNFVGVGIRKRVAEILNRHHFESGFLMRMTWAVGDAPKYHKGDSDIKMREDIGGDVYDPRQAAMMLDLVKRRGRVAPDLAMRFEPDALDRLNAFAHALHMACDDEVLEAAVDRLRDSVMKAASLLAYYYGDSKIGMYPLLCAIAQGELWFEDLRRMLSEVSDSAFGGVLNEVEKFIAAGGNHQRTEAEVFRKFTFRPQEFNEVIAALQKAGRVRRVPNAAGRLEVLM